MKRILLSIALLAASASVAQAQSTVTVENQSFDPATVYAVSASGTRIRLGRVEGLSSVVLTLNRVVRQAVPTPALAFVFRGGDAVAVEPISFARPLSVTLLSGKNAAFIR